jgi:chorismate mutase
MQRLRLKVDQIDLKILKLLQQRIKLSAQIGEVKRRYGAPVYAPQREGELRAHLLKLNRGKLQPQAVVSMFREIMSSSRAVQGQAPIGLLPSVADASAMAARWHFGACDEFVPKKNWIELAAGLVNKKLAAALLTGEDLALALKTAPARKHFLAHFHLVGDFSPSSEADVSLARRVLIVTLRNQGVACLADHAVILIECKSTGDTVKRLVKSMSDRSIHAEELSLGGQSVQSATAAVVRLSLPKQVDPAQAGQQLVAIGQAAGLQISLLGVYPGTENYAG